MEIFEYHFMINAIIASVLASIVCGIIGSYVVVKRIVFITGGIAHTAYGGIGLGYLLSFNPLFGAIGISLLSAGLISNLRGRNKQTEDILIGIIWALGMSIGVVAVGFSSGYAPDLMSYLFGNILMIGSADLYIMLILDIIIIVSVFTFFDQFQAVTFDEEFANSIGLNTRRYYLFLLLLIGLTVVILIKLVGIILVIALITIPAATSLRFVKSLKQMMLMSTILGFVFTIFGLFLSYYLNLASGASIILLSVIGYFISFGVKKAKLSSNTEFS